MMTEKERKRFFRKATHPFLGLGFNPQIILIESCISEKTPVAPMNREINPTTVANVVLLLMAACLMISCNWRAVS